MRNWSKITYPALFVILIALLMVPGCKKKEDNLSGSWSGVLTINLSHQHEEFQQWTEIIEHPDGTPEEIVHEEHIVWSFSNTVTINFQFNIDTPVYEAQINGTGSAQQQAAFNATTQCHLTAFSAPDFKVSIYGSVDSSTFTIQVAPDSIPTVSINQQCANVHLRLPVYGSSLLDVLSEIHLTVPSESGISTGGSGTVSGGSGFTQVAYIYNLTLNKN